MFEHWHQRNRQDDEIAATLPECFEERLAKLIATELKNGAEKEELLEALKDATSLVNDFVQSNLLNKK